MTEQASIFDFVEANEALDEALNRVDANADEEWKTTALRAVGWLSMTQDRFTTDDVWAVLVDREEATHEPRALGPIMLRARKLGYIAGTNDYVLSMRPECHRNPKKVWRSLLFEPSTGVSI
jgi:hypothetical protein